MTTRWVLVDDTQGAPCANGQKLDQKSLQEMATVLSIQLNRDYAAEYGGSFICRAASNPRDIMPGELVFAWQKALPDAPGAIAYHDISGAAVRFAVGAITQCADLFGAEGVLAATSHELLEDAGDPGCNVWVSDGRGKLHAREMCDGCEVQSYPINGLAVSDFFLGQWWLPGGHGAYNYCAKVGKGHNAPGPLASISANGGNYQIVETDPQDVSQIMASQAQGLHHMMAMHRPGRLIVIDGTPRNAEKVKHWSSRPSRRLGLDKMKAVV
jgi:hypothetical protein